MLTPKDCKRLDPTLKGLSDDYLQRVLDELYAYADFFWDRWVKAGHGIPNVSRKDIEAEMKRKV